MTNWSRSHDIQEIVARVDMTKPNQVGALGALLAADAAAESAWAAVQLAAVNGKPLDRLIATATAASQYRATAVDAFDAAVR